MSTKTISLDERELMALERGTEMFKQCALNGEEALEEAKVLLGTYNKLVDRLIGQIIDKMCQCARAEDATRAAVSLIKTHGSQETKTALAMQLRNLPAASEYRNNSEKEWGQQATIETLKSRTNEAINKWSAMISPDVMAADGLITVLRSLEQRAQHKQANPARTPRAVAPPPTVEVPPPQGDEEGEAKVEEFFSEPTPVQPRRVDVPDNDEPFAVSGNRATSVPKVAAADSVPRVAGAPQVAPLKPLVTKDGVLTAKDEDKTPAVFPQRSPRLDRSPRPEKSPRPDRPPPAVVVTPASNPSTSTVAASPPVAAAATPVTTPTTMATATPKSGSASNKTKMKFATLTRKSFISFFAANKDEADDMQIGGPTNVQHAAHVGPNATPDPDAVKKMTDDLLLKQKIEVEARAKAVAEEQERERKRLEEEEAAAAAQKKASSPSPSPPPSVTRRTPSASKQNSSWLGTLRRKPAAVTEDEPEIQIGAPEEVAHDGHVGVAEAKPEAVADVIDSVVNKQKSVNVEDVLAEEIPFAEEYDPGPL